MTKREFIEKAKECGYSRKDILGMVLLAKKIKIPYKELVLLNKIDEEKLI